MTQSKNPFKPDYVDPWYFKIVDKTPNWVAFLIWFLFLSMLAIGLGAAIQEIFCVCK